MNAATNKQSETNWDKVDSLDDQDIDLSDIPPLSESFFSRAAIRVPCVSVPITINVDSALVSWFKA